MIGFRQAARRVAAVAVMAATAGVTTGALAGSSGGAAHKPFRIYGNTYYVGTADHASILVNSDYGFLLIDTGPKEAAGQVAANIQALGFKLSDLKAILVSDARPEHSGGVGELQMLSGAQVYTAREGEQKLRAEKIPAGKPLKNDPREGARVGAIPMLPQVWVVEDDQLLGVSSVRLRALATPGGSPEGISWSFDACDGSKCLPTIYAASLEPAGKRKDRAETQKALEASLARLDGAPCQLLLTPRPDDSGGLDRLEKAAGKQDVLKNDGACKAYVKQERERLAKR